MRRLYPVFHIIRLMTATEDLIPGQHVLPLLDLIVVDRKEEWEVEKVLDSHWHHKQYQYFIK